MPDVCCLYSSIFTLDRPLSDFWTPLGRLWTVRWLIFAKALQLGYNILHVDNDVMLTQDIYRCAASDHTSPQSSLTGLKSEVVMLATLSEPLQLLGIMHLTRVHDSC